MFLEHLSSGKLPKCFTDCIAKTPVSTEMQASWLDCSNRKDKDLGLVKRGQVGGGYEIIR